MKCPACRRALTPIEVSNVIVEICSDGCGGIWFERGKLDRLADPADPAAEALAAMSAHAQVQGHPRGASYGCSDGWCCSYRSSKLRSSCSNVEDPLCRTAGRAKMTEPTTATPSSR